MLEELIIGGEQSLEGINLGLIWSGKNRYAIPTGTANCLALILMFFVLLDRIDYRHVKEN